MSDPIRGQVAPIGELRRKVEEARDKKPAQQEVVVAPISVLRQKFEEAARKHGVPQSQPQHDDQSQVRTSLYIAFCDY